MYQPHSGTNGAVPSMSPEEMIARALSGDDDRSYSQELYSVFYRGLPIEKLRPLLTSTSPRAQALGSYLAYELGWRVHPFVRELTALLENPNPQIRSDAMYALRDCTTPNDGAALGRVISMLGDSDPFVQRGAMRFVQFCQRWQLNLGVNEAAKLKPDTIFGLLPKFVGRASTNYVTISQKIIEHLVGHPDAIANRFGVGLAARPRLVVDDTFLDIAARCDDEECRTVLEMARKHPLPTYAISGRLSS